VKTSGYGWCILAGVVNKISFLLSSYADHERSVRDFPDLEAGVWGGAGETALFGDLRVKGITKQSAAECLLEHLHAHKEDAVAFGDAAVDIPMFEACGYAVAMGSGGEECRAAADYITDGVNEDGLYNAFRHLKLI
jgi:hydroxymethylpyrimidine pyrophosphatase-like HAD family hydrolase